jgi:glycosyltransferase involved in cell wall biosynthesis
MQSLRSGSRDSRDQTFALLQTTLPAYRDAFIRRLLAESPSSVVWAGHEYFDPSTRLSSFGASCSRRLKNRFLLDRRLEWQQGAFAAALAPSVVVLELNPRILSNWPILVCRRILGRRTVVWGHAWPRRGANSKSFLVRIPLLHLADGVLVYTEADRAQLESRVRTPVFVAPNAVVSSSQWPSTFDGNPINAVQVGRLVPSKKPHLTLEAWLSICSELEDSARLIFVGDGPDRESLERIAARHKFRDRVKFMGAVNDRAILSDVYASALVSISAGYAGLSLTDSLGYGVPMIIADKEPHAPEIVLASKSNSRFFEAGSASSLARELLQVFTNRESWVAKRPALAAEVRATYSIEAMVEGFLAAVRGDNRSRN